MSRRVESSRGESKCYFGREAKKGSSGSALDRWACSQCLSFEHLKFFCCFLCAFMLRLHQNWTFFSHRIFLFTVLFFVCVEEFLTAFQLDKAAKKEFFVVGEFQEGVQGGDNVKWNQFCL